jgi:uncharacterized RDD family membrane protein YckC
MPQAAMAQESDPVPPAERAVRASEGTNAEFELAPLWKRFLAYAIDLGVVGAIMYGVLVVGLLSFLGGAAVAGIFKNVTEGNPGMAIAGIAMLLVIFLAAMAFYHGYFIYFEHKTGQTPGKKLFGLKVISTQGSSLTFSQCVMRDFMRYIDCGLIFPGLISMAVSEKRQRLGDLLCSTLVVYSRKGEEGEKFLYVKQADFEYMKGLLSPLPVTEEICRQFLHVAYPIFILGKLPSHPEDLLPWEELARTYLPGAKGQNLDQTTILLFFAEHCFQSHYRTQNA